MLEINPCEIQSILNLLPDRDCNMSLEAAAEGKAGARVWVNSVEKPTVAVVCLGYRLIICGDPRDDNCKYAIIDFLNNVILENRVDRMRNFAMIFWQEPAWRKVLLNTLEEYRCFEVQREYYLLDTSTCISECRLPERYSLKILNVDFLNERQWNNKEVLESEMCSERDSVEEFFAYSFGVCAVFEDEIVGWCLSEYNNLSGCEVGIEVVHDHCRAGIATAMTLAFVGEARKRGLRYVGWSCFKSNVPSSATARKAGFKKLKEYEAILLSRQESY